MIVSFQHKGLRIFWETGSKKFIQPAHERKLRRLLSALDVASTPEDLNLPGWSLHRLTGNLEGFYSLKINGNWRVIFRFDGQDTELLDYLDYH